MTEAEKPASSIDVTGIFKSVGDVPYEWLIDSDVLNWGDNAASVLGVGDASAIATGRAFAAMLDPGSPVSRFDAVMKSSEPGNENGVLFHVEYCLRPNGLGDSKLWIEDVGRWFPGPDGRPARAHGVVRAINERHEQEEHLAYLSQFDALTGEINRWRLTTV
ncbi:MAG TPA: GGDEF-domain containing protein, partial [Xanthobacteraceae bacterium]|nr:GGDEF-domain containing protein [Xanthobacteraceae bacterium]